MIFHRLIIKFGNLLKALYRLHNEFNPFFNIFIYTKQRLAIKITTKNGSRRFEFKEKLASKYLSEPSFGMGKGTGKGCGNEENRANEERAPGGKRQRRIIQTS
jgi:hypothetical protein